MTTIDDGTIRDKAREIILDHAGDVEYMSIGEMMDGDPCYEGLSQDEFEAVQSRIDKMIRSAVVTVTFPGDSDSGTGEQAPQCDSHAHSDFVADRNVRCELPEGHPWHRNGERTWTP